MQMKKWIATGLSALMAGATLAGAALAADLSTFPAWLATTTTASSSLNAFIVVGDDAKAQDIAGAVDIAARLSELNYVLQSTTTTSTTGLVGLEKNGISLGTVAGGSGLTTGAPSPSNNAFPSATLKNAQYSGLWQGILSFNGANFNAHEQVSTSGVLMRHDYGTSNINGTEKMVVGTSSAITAQYVFDSAVTALGSATTPNYTQPLTISFLGQTFKIVGADSTGITILSGSVGPLIKTATQDIGITDPSGKYTVHLVQAFTSGSTTADVAIQDATGKVVDGSLTGIAVGQTKTSSITGLSIQVTDISVAGNDPTTQYQRVGVVVGPSGTTQLTIGTTADTSSTSKQRFPGTTDWFLTTSSVGSTAGTIAAAASLNAEYHPSSTVYDVAGQNVMLPGDYAELGYQGFNTNQFATVTIKPISSVSAVNSTGGALQNSVLYGLEISADGNSIGSGFLTTPNWYNTMYVLFNQTITNGAYTYLPVFVGYKNAAGNKQINDTPTGTGNINANVGLTFNVTGATELPWGVVNITASPTNATLTLPFKVNYNGGGSETAYINVTLNTRLALGSPVGFLNASIGRVGSAPTITADFENKTAFIANAANLGSDLLRLGPTAASAETNELNATTEATVYSIATAQQDIVDDSGIQVVSPTSNSPSDRVVLKVPSVPLGNDVYFGKVGGNAVSAGGSIHAISPIKTAVAQLASQVGAGTAARTQKNLVLVGGPCANTVVQELVAAGKIPVQFTCAGGSPGAGWVDGNSYIWLINDAFTTGKVALVVAGTTKDDTRFAASVLQNYDATGVKSKLIGTGVKISGSDVQNPTIVPA